MPDLSVVVPVYGSPDSLRPLAQRVAAAVATLGLTYELVLVDDRCPKDSWSTIVDLCRTDAAVKGLRLSRNFGQHSAIQAGLRKSTGTWIVVMDCDLQDQPEEIPRLYRKATQGFDVVRAKRGERSSDSWGRRAGSKIFNALLGFLTNTEQTPEVAHFGIFHRKVIDAINSWDENTKYFPAIAYWVGFSRCDIDVQHSARYEGRSSYTLSKLVNLAFDVVVGFSDRPLRLLMIGGVSLAFVSFLMSLVILLLRLFGHFQVEGWTSLMLSVWFLAGCTFFALGLTGSYVGRALLEAKGRPPYIIDEVFEGPLRANRPLTMSEGEGR